MRCKFQHEYLTFYKVIIARVQLPHFVKTPPYRKAKSGIKTEVALCVKRNSRRKSVVGVDDECRLRHHFHAVCIHRIDTLLAYHALAAHHRVVCFGQRHRLRLLGSI